MYFPLYVMLVHPRVTPSIKFTSNWMERGTVRVMCSVLLKDTMQCPQPGLEPGPFSLEMSVLTMRPQHLPPAIL